MTDKAPMTERIMAAADRLFYQKGIRAVGVDSIAAEAGISKRSLYDNFASKDALVAAYLERRIQPMPDLALPPAQQVLALFDGLHARFASGVFRGCPFVNAVAELAEDCSAARQIAERFKDGRRERIADWLGRAGAVDPEGLAEHVALLIEGAIASMLVREDAAVALRARDAAVVLMHAGGVALADRGAGRE